MHSISNTSTSNAATSPALVRPFRSVPRVSTARMCRMEGIRPMGLCRPRALIERFDDYG